MSIILELQHDAANSDINISDLLRKALIVAKKLNLNDFENWIKNEMNGYSIEEQIPNYREVHGICRYFNPYHGWQDIMFHTEKEKAEYCTRKVKNKISELENLISTSNDNFIIQFPSEIQNIFANAHCGLVPELIIGSDKVNGILNNVRDKIMDWALNLENEGILGENMSFNTQEKEAAKSVTVTNYIGNIYGSQFQQGNHNSNIMNNDQPNINDITELVDNIKALLLKMEQSAVKQEIQSDINTVEQQLSSPKPKINIIKELLLSTRTVLEGTCSSLLASYPIIQEGFNKIFGS